MLPEKSLSIFSNEYDLNDRKDKSIAPTPRGDDGIEKTQKFGWGSIGKKGELKYIDKHLLGIDKRYQRDEVSEKKIVRMAREWKWVSCGCISVVQRKDGSYWVYDGGHRVRASFYRKEIVDLPCIVFKAEDISIEADAFITTNTTKAMVKAWNMFQAGLTAKREYAIDTKKLLDDHGLKATCHRDERGGFSAIATLMSLVQKDKELASRVFGLCASISTDGEQIPSMTLKGLFVLAQLVNKRYMGKKGYDILSGEYVDRYRAIGLEGMEKVINRYKARSGGAGTRNAAMAILEQLNKGRKSRKISITTIGE